MANRVEAFQCTILAGTTKAAPHTVPLPFDEGDVQRIEIVVPDGVAGLAGFYIAKGGQQIIPVTTGQYLISNDEKIGWDLTEQPEGTGWQLVGYNTDVFTHSFYVRFLISDYHLNAGITDNSLAFAIPPVTVPTGG